MNQTTLLKNEQTTHDWYVASAKGKVLGQFAVEVARALMGRGNPNFTPNADNGNFVVITDVEGLVVTRNKAEKKIYAFHTGYFGGLNEYTFADLQSRHPDRILMLAVRRMMPKNIQARHQLKRLKMYKGPAHPHQAQAPKPLPGV